LTGKILKYSAEEKEIKRLEIDKQRDKQEADISGGYRRIHPCEDENLMQKYK